MDYLIYAAVMGFVMAMPFGAIGAACALATMQHRLRDTLQLAAGVMFADALGIAVV